METNDRGRFDEVLNKALRQYGNVEPRIGLENRILANMEVAGTRAHSGYRWVLAGAIATALVIAIGGGIWHQALIPKQNVPASAVSQNALGEVSSATVPRTPQIAKTRASRQRRHVAAGSSVASTRSPKLDQFPSPLPLSQQELLFASYAEHFPKEALLIAQEQRDFEEEIRLAERDVRQLPQVYIEEGE
jgi:hypothetical protein